jgi:hypothetical protein
LVLVTFRHVLCFAFIGKWNSFLCVHDHIILSDT